MTGSRIAKIVGKSVTAGSLIGAQLDPVLNVAPNICVCPLSSEIMKMRFVERTTKISIETSSDNTVETSAEEDEEIKRLLKTDVLGRQRKFYSIFIDTYNIPKYEIVSKKFTEDAIRSIEAENAGGKSWLSEALSINYFFERFNAHKFILEMEVEYWIQYKMCDYVCNIGDMRFGVSVTRALGFPNLENFDLKAAYTLLHKKLHGLVIARNGVSMKHDFYKCVLHVWCQTEEIAEMLRIVYPRILKEDQTNTIRDVTILLTICNQEFIYTNEEDEEKKKKKELLKINYPIKPSTLRRRIMRRRKREHKINAKLGIKDFNLCNSLILEELKNIVVEIDKTTTRAVVHVTHEDDDDIYYVNLFEDEL